MSSVCPSAVQPERQSANEHGIVDAAQAIGTNRFGPVTGQHTCLIDYASPWQPWSVCASLFFLLYDDCQHQLLPIEGTSMLGNNNDRQVLLSADTSQWSTRVDRVSSSPMASMSRPVARRQSKQKGRIQHNPIHGCVSGSEELKKATKPYGANALSVRRKSRPAM